MGTVDKSIPWFPGGSLEPGMLLLRTLQTDTHTQSLRLGSAAKRQPRGVEPHGLQQTVNHTLLNGAVYSTEHTVMVSPAAPAAMSAGGHGGQRL